MAVSRYQASCVWARWAIIGTVIAAPLYGAIFLTMNSGIDGFGIGLLGGLLAALILVMLPAAIVIGVTGGILGGSHASPRTSRLVVTGVTTAVATLPAVAVGLDELTATLPLAVAATSWIFSARAMRDIATLSDNPWLS